MSTERKFGNLISFYPRGFGFIEMVDDQGNHRTIFCHAKSFPNRCVIPPVGTVLSFEIEDSPKGFAAKKIQILGQPSGSSSNAGVNADVDR